MNRPKTLSFTNDENEYEDEPNDMMDEIHEDHQSNGLFSPALSDSPNKARERTVARI